MLSITHGGNEGNGPLQPAQKAFDRGSISPEFLSIVGVEFFQAFPGVFMKPLAQLI